MAESSGNSKLSYYDKNNLNDSINQDCKVCDIYLNSPEQYKEHIKGQKHISKEETFKYGLLLPKDDDSSHLLLQSLSTPSNRADNDEVVKSVPKSSSTFQDNYSRCELCNVDFTSKTIMDDHYGGKKHALALKKSSINHPLSCEVCNMRFSSQISANDHFKSGKHMKKIAFGNNSPLQSIGSTGRDKTQWVHCDVCNVDLNSMQQLRIHRLSDKHKKKERSLSEDVNETNQGTISLPTHLVGPTGLKELLPNGMSSPSPGKKETVAMKLMSNIPVESANQIPMVLNKITNFENFCDQSKSSPGLSPGSIALKSVGNAFQKCTIPSDSESVISGRESRSPSSSPARRPSNSTQETTMKEIRSITSDLPTKKVQNSAQNNYATDISSTRRSNNSPQITNNLTVPEETTTQPRKDSDSQPSISNAQIDSIINGLQDLSISLHDNEAERLADYLGNERQSSPDGHGRRRPRTVEDEIPQLQKDYIESVEKKGILLCYFCSLCSSQVCIGAVKSHIEGMNHRQKMMKLLVPKSRVLPPVKQDCEDPTDEAFNLTKFIPRGYQVELFEKCYSNDSIIFLPTGTGKTLCASMLISYMLKQNPMRSVLFLVDKVLLVLQQKTFIERQLKQKFTRFDFEDHQKLVERELTIACVCGGKVGIEDKPLWMHDIIISTAAYCTNMMEQNVLCWSDFSFVVVDEAHHCVKNHPFRKIFTTQHSKLEKHERPKILGLTASPAGKETLPGTIKMLASLIKDMGDAKIAIVEDSVNLLQKYKSNAKLEVEMLPPNNEEVRFNSNLRNYLMECLLHLKERSNICDYFDLKTKGDENTLDAERLDELQSAFNYLTIKSDRVVTTSLLFHVKKITSALAVSLEMGIPLALEELKSLIDKSNNIDGFSRALELGLPAKALELGHEIKVMCEKHLQVMNDELWERDEIMSTVYFLIHKITTLLDKENENAIVLVLVKQRATAMRLSAIMQASNTMKERGLSCVSLVGHGAGSSTGMNVNDQKRTLEEISRNLHQVIIATSVAEEGIDLPECSLVITMKPPTSITALVQMRGRARKKHSLFLTICGNEKQKVKLENLLKQEQIMELATQKLVEYYKK